jgi:Flp pilus assembly protein TadG
MMRDDLNKAVPGRHFLRRLWQAESGVAAVEFSLILPILVVLWIGGVEVTSALSVDRRLNNLASSIGDLTARCKQLTYDDVDDIFSIAPGAMYPYGGDTLAALVSEGMSLRLTAVDVDDEGDATVAWSRAQGTQTAHNVGASMNTQVPETLRVPESQLIMSEVYYTYRPTVGYVITGPRPLSDRMFFIPRLAATVELDDASEGCDP